ncbi:MAG: hypothetical protein Q9169_007995 [Polycauliona sp. 2 TL-2023]
MGNLNDDGFHKSILSLLPIELRQHIYSHVLEYIHLKPHVLEDIHPKPISPHAYAFNPHDLTPNNDKTQAKAQHTNRTKTALLQTCRHIYNEAIDPLYQECTVILECLTAFKKFMITVPPLRFAKIRHFRIELLRLQLHPPVHTPMLACHRDCSPSSMPQWEDLWSAVASIRDLRTFNVRIGLQIFGRRDHRYWEDMLGPLLGLGGMKRFELEVWLVSALELGMREQIDSSVLELVEKVKERARGPRNVPLGWRVKR